MFGPIVNKKLNYSANFLSHFFGHNNCTTLTQRLFRINIQPLTEKAIVFRELMKMAYEAFRMKCLQDI